MPSSRRTSAAVVAIAAACLVPLLAQSPPVPPDVSPKAGRHRPEVRGRVRKEFRVIVADEWYQQVQRDRDGRILLERVLKSEVFSRSCRPTANGSRCVTCSKSTAVRLRAATACAILLAKGGQFRGVAKQVIDLNARYNIGSVSRNFNEPTLPLLLFEPRRAASVEFDRKNVSRDGASHTRHSVLLRARLRHHRRGPRRPGARERYVRHRRRPAAPFARPHSRSSTRTFVRC
jgi:hypothetical protein